MRRSKLSLTPTICSRTKPGATKLVLWDADVLGLCIVITPSGTRTFFFVPRRGGKQIWIRLGEYHAARTDIEKLTVWTVDAARGEAGRLRKLHDEGKDVRALMVAQRSGKTLADLAAHYQGSVGYKGLAARSQTAYGGYLKNHILPALGQRLVGDITHQDILDMQAAIAEKATPPISVTAGNCVDLLGLMLDYAADLGWRPRGDNPRRGIKTVKSQDRTRIATVDELEQVGLGIGDGLWGLATRLIAYSGMRISECLALPWDDVDLAARVLTIRDHKTVKTMGVKTLPINTAMAGVFAALQAHQLGPWVFRGLKGNHRASVSMELWWVDLVKPAGLQIHDLRRTFQTTGTELGCDPGVMDVLVGHKLPGMRATYVHLSPGGILGLASEATGAWIQAAMDGQRPKIGVRV